MFIHFLDRMSREDVAEAVSSLLDEGFPVETLLLFESVLRGEDRKRLLRRVEAETPASPNAWIVLGEWHHEAERNEKAKEALRRARVLLRAHRWPGRRRLSRREDRRSAPIRPGRARIMVAD